MTREAWLRTIKSFEKLDKEISDLIKNNSSLDAENNSNSKLYNYLKNNELDFNRLKNTINIMNSLNLLLSQNLDSVNSRNKDFKDTKSKLEALLKRLEEKKIDPATLEKLNKEKKDQEKELEQVLKKLHELQDKLRELEKKKKELLDQNNSLEQEKNFKLQE